MVVKKLRIYIVIPGLPRDLVFVANIEAPDQVRGDRTTVFGGLYEP